MTGRMLGVFMLALVATVTSCSKSVQRVDVYPDRPAQIDELWQEPRAPRDLFHGPGGQALAPANDATFTFVSKDTGGWSPGYDVTDATGLEWSVKLGAEAQSEVVTSRILWALGYHQPPVYYLERWTLVGGEAGPQTPGRFRAELPTQQVAGDWSWYENPFVGSRPYGGLVVTNLMLNSWDWKTSNNKLYHLSEPVDDVTRWFIVRDVGASLGKTTYPAILKWFRLRGFGQGTRNDLPGFESQGFITRIEGERVKFDYSGIYRDVLDTVTPADVRWTSQRLEQLSDQQWTDAFRAAGYTTEQTARYVAKIKSKIDQGLALTGG